MTGPSKPTPIALEETKFQQLEPFDLSKMSSMDPAELASQLELLTQDKDLVRQVLTHDQIKLLDKFQNFLQSCLCPDAFEYDEELDHGQSDEKVILDPVTHEVHRLVKTKGRRRDDADCHICMEKVRASGQQFGVLEGCDHTFCLKCIRAWRATADKRTSKKHYRTCPICRQNSFLVIPSNYLVQSGPQKDKLIEEYNSALRKIPCKHFKLGEGRCPF